MRDAFYCNVPKDLSLSMNLSRVPKLVNERGETGNVSQRTFRHSFATTGTTYASFAVAGLAWHL